jgi:hypothetical protein
MYKIICAIALLMPAMTGQAIKYDSYRSVPGGSINYLAQTDYTCYWYQSDWANMFGMRYIDDVGGVYLVRSQAATSTQTGGCGSGATKTFVNYGIIVAYNTTTIQPTDWIKSAVLHFKVGSKENTGAFPTTRGLYIRTMSNMPPETTDFPTNMMVDPVANRVGQKSWAEITGNEWNTVTLSNPNTTIKKGQLTVLYFMWADIITATEAPYTWLPKDVIYYHGVEITSTGGQFMGLNPDRSYLMIEFANTTQMIILSDS